MGDFGNYNQFLWNALLSDLYWTRCKSPSVLIFFCLILPWFWCIFAFIVSIYDSIITMNDKLLDDNNIAFIFDVLFHIFVTLEKMISNKFNKSLVICVEKRHRITEKSNKILISWSQLLFLAHIGLQSKEKVAILCTKNVENQIEYEGGLHLDR